MSQVRLITCVVGFLCLSFLNACQWDTDTELQQGLSNEAEAQITSLSDISDAEQCRSACCGKDDCQLALIGFPADGTPQCHLVNCMKDGKDVCVLSHNSQFQVYRKIQDTADDRVVNTTERCYLPNLVGNCRAAMPRFYYNVTSQTCKQFIYGGCGGNSNNFNTQEECEASCAGVKGEHSVAQRSRMSVPENKVAPPSPNSFEEMCAVPSDSGRCRAAFPKFFFDASSQSCKLFTYGGCGGNLNRYNSEEECMSTCSGKEVKVAPPSPKSFEEMCAVPSDSGHCRAAFPKFFFDASSQSCKLFTYGGCGGNLNRYNSEEECMSTCSGNDGRFDQHGHHKRNRWTPAFFLVATLAIMSALLLVGLILITVRRNAHRHLILDDKEELLPAEEQVSYEKLTEKASS